MIHKIYSLKDPLTGEIKYVGRTNGDLVDRLVEHIGEVSTRTTSGTKSVGSKKKWIRDLVTKNLIPIIELLDEVATHEECIAREYYWQAELKMQGCQLFGNTLKIGAEDLRSLINDIKTKNSSNRALSLYYNLDRKAVKLLKGIYAKEETE